MLVRILIAVAAVLVVFALVVASRPAAFSISRSIVVAAPPAVVYAQVADFKSWDAWSPWGKLDPAMKTTYQGQPGQVGASYYWIGNDKVGEGRMTLIEVQAPATLNIKLEFLKPFTATNESRFSFVPAGPGTLVSWSMSGQNNFVAKAFSIFMNMDKMVGGDFERGLAQLKSVSESAARKQTAQAVPAAAIPADSAAQPATK